MPKDDDHEHPTAAGAGGLDFRPAHVGYVYGTFSIGAIVAPLVVGLLADRWFAVEKVIAVAHAAMAALIGGAAVWCDTFDGAASDPDDAVWPLFWLILGYAIGTQITLTLNVVISFRNLSGTGGTFWYVRLVGTLLEPLVTREHGTLDLDADGNIRCAACDCGPAGDALVIDCPDLVISPGFINLHDHLSYSGTPPLPHPGELYQHRNDWRLGENGHAALPFAGGASTAEVLAHELRMLMSGTTSMTTAWTI